MLLLSSRVGSAPAMGPGGDDNPPKKGNVSYSNLISGDIEEGFKEADHIIEYRLYLPPLLHICPTLPVPLPGGMTIPITEGKSLHIEGAVRERRAISAMYNVPLEDSAGRPVHGREVL